MRKKPALRRKKTITRPPPIDTDKIQSAYKSDDAKVEIEAPEKETKKRGPPIRRANSEAFAL